MTKKFSRFAILTIILLFALSMPVFAREVDIDDIGQQLDELQTKLGVDIDSYYIIGNYVFTSQNILNTRDIMLAARSIQMQDDKEYSGENSDDFLSQMSIHQVERTFDDQWNPTGWNIKNNFVGDTKITNETKLNIRFIDYEYLKDIYTVTLDTDGGNEYKASITVEEGGKIDENSITGTNAPTKTGKKFKEWVKDDGTKWNFASDTVNGNITLKATWYEEINTDNLLKEAIKKIESTDYGAEFANGTLTYNIYDKNKKNSEIKDTGLVGTIRDILKNENVKSLTITYAGETFTFDDSGMDTDESKAYKELQRLLVKVAGGNKEFKNIIQGDLVGKELELKINLNEDKAHSQNNNTTEKYTVKFLYNEPATIGIEIPSADLTDLKDTFNYIPENTYQITKTADGLYKVTGGISNQTAIKGFGEQPKDGYYFAYTITLNEGIDSANAKAKIPISNNQDVYNEENFDATAKTLTVLMEVEKNDLSGENNGYRDIIVEVNGAPTKIRIDFSSLELRKSSNFKIQSGKEDDKLQKEYGWQVPEEYEANFTNEGNKVTISGVIPYLDSWNEEKNSPFSGKDETGYYLALVLETNDIRKDETTVKFTNGYEGDETVILGKNFDEEKKLYVLKHLHLDDATKTFDIIVDLDGDKTEYNPYTITVDWNKLLLQKNSETEIKLSDPHEDDKKEMDEWQYDKSKNENLKLENGILTGKLVEQQLTSEPFGENNKDGYYFDFKLISPEGVDKSKIKIAQVNAPDTNAKAIKEYKETEFDAENNLTILFQFKLGTTGCEVCKNESTCQGACCKGSENCNCDKKLYYRIDWDGDGKEYLPNVYVIDYCGVTFEKSSIVEISDIGTTGNFDNENWKGFKEDDNYSTKFETNGNIVKATGLITIFDDEKWNDKNNPFGTSANDYYLAFKLKKTGTEGTNTNTTVKFLTDGQGDGDINKISKADFGENNEIYVLKHINPFKENTSKNFTIKIDFDDEDEEYAEYSVVIDWSELKFQVNSNTGSDYEIVNIDNIELEDKTTLETTYGYDFSLDNISYIEENKPEGGTYHTGLKGTVKQQTLKPDAGFGEDAGYYVPVKITIPMEELPKEYHDKWTIYLKNDDGEEYIEKTPSETDYKNGYIVVLFKMKDDIQDIHYKIDYDGSKNNDYIISDVITIKTEFTFLSENKVTFEYFDEINGTIIQKTEKVYQGEKIDETLAPKLGEYTYHNFDYWYKTSDNSKNKFDFNSSTTGKNEDITLKAHWTILADTFLADVVKDLANAESEITFDYSDIFEVSKTGNTITFKIKDSTTKLSEMNNTSIPGAIAYILKRGEVKDITLSSGAKKVVFTKDGANNIVETISLDSEGTNLKEKIQAGAKALFTDILGSSQNEQNMTLNKMAVDERKFSLTIGALDDSVKLTDGAESEYTFNFETDMAVVNSEEELKAALLNKKVSHIDVSGNFEVQEPIEVSRKVEINGGSDKHIITANGVDTIFKVSNSDITIDNIVLKDAKTPVVVESGTLTSNGITVEGENTEAAFVVKNGATLTASLLTYDNENYEKPAVKAEKSNATVNLTDSTTKPAKKLENIEKIIRYEEQAEPKDRSIGDIKQTDSEYNYYNYYNKEENSKIYSTNFYNYEGRQMAWFIRYDYYNAQVQLPPKDKFGVFYTLNYEGNKYILLGFTEERNNTVHGDDIKDDNLPQGVISKDKLFATEDKHYYASYKVTLPEGVRKVTDADTFKSALQDQSVHEIYIDTLEEIDITSMGDITIGRQLSITGRPAKAKLKVKNIKVTADNVFMQRINLTFTGPTGDTLIDVSQDAQDFSLWQCSLTNGSDSSVKYAVKYNGNTKSVVDIRWTSFANSNNKITESYIYVETPLAAGSDIYDDTFPKLTSDDNNKKSAITIKKFASDEVLTNEDNIRIGSNTFNSADYAIKILKDASNTKASISLTTRSDIIIAVEYDDSNNNFGKIKLDTDTTKVKVKYIKEDQISDTLVNGTEISFKSEEEVNGNTVAESATQM